jgi:hypothetical protein
MKTSIQLALRRVSGTPHYRQKFINQAAGFLNRIISKRGRLALMLAPFIYVIARPKNAA